MKCSPAFNSRSQHDHGRFAAFTTNTETPKSTKQNNNGFVFFVAVVFVVMRRRRRGQRSRRDRL